LPNFDICKNIHLSQPNALPLPPLKTLCPAGVSILPSNLAYNQTMQPTPTDPTHLITKTFYDLATAASEESDTFQPDLILVLAHGARPVLWALQTLWGVTSHHPLPPVVVLNIGREKLERYYDQRPQADWVYTHPYVADYAGEIENGYFLAWQPLTVDNPHVSTLRQFLPVEQILAIPVWLKQTVQNGVKKHLQSATPSSTDILHLTLDPYELLLKHLWINKQLTAGEAATLLGVSTQKATRMLMRLVGAEWVEKKTERGKTYYLLRDSLAG